MDDIIITYLERNYEFTITPAKTVSFKDKFGNTIPFDAIVKDLALNFF